MADRTGLKLVGFAFATVMVTVVMTAGFVVKGHADGRFVLEGTATTLAELSR